MKIPVRLQELLQQPDQSIAFMSGLMGQKNAFIDGSGVENVPPDKLALLLSEIPPDWDFVELAGVFDAETLSETFAMQLSEEIDRRQGRSPRPRPVEVLPPDPNQRLDIFNLRDEVVDDYQRYIRSFLKIRDDKVNAFVTEGLAQGELWPNPLIQLNPAYKKGATVTELAEEGILHPNCVSYFSTDKGIPFTFHYHQEQAFRIAHRQEPFVVTTGTGSGKSMTYVVPIFDDLLHNPGIKGVRAILVYPMNALINSQKNEFQKFLDQVPNSHIRVEQYTGQEGLQKKTEIQENPPQILLTNYVMLELMLSRNQEDKLVASPDLQFLILDELHTYRGRQGADVSMLIRKLRQRCGRDLLCVGTSATMSTEGTRQNRRETVAGVASKLFGVEVPEANIVDETLERAIERSLPAPDELRRSITQGIPTEDEQTLDAFKAHPLSAWIEMTFGLEEQEGCLVRRTPISLVAGAKQLAEETQLEPEACLEVLKQMFLWGSKTEGLAFRLHQFISQGGSVYATIEAKDKRYLTLEGQYTTTEDRLLYPLVFCRECGHDYYMVQFDTHKMQVLPSLPIALDSEIDGDEIQAGYITLQEPGLWQEDDEDRLPDNWFRVTKAQGRTPKKEYAAFIPRRFQVLPNGQVTSSLLEGASAWFTPQPFLVCLNCGVVHEKRKNEFAKLARLSSEGRSTATTLLCLSTVSRLKDVLQGEKAKAAKILSFTDNRQDASLQAGHFNDFVQTSLLRAALSRALQNRRSLTHAELASQVFAHMGIRQQDYAKSPSDIESPGKQRNERVFRELIEYRLYEDLRRGWRIVQPNLEQCGLLSIQYDRLESVCEQQALWEKYRHPILLRATPTQRSIAAKALLDQLRKELALDAALLQRDRLDQLKKEVTQAIVDPWAFDYQEYLPEAKWASITAGDSRKKGLKLTARSKVGRFLRSDRAWPWLPHPLPEQDYEELLTTLIRALEEAGYLLRNRDKVQLRIDAMVWQTETLTHIPLDPLNARQIQGTENREIEVNQFFREFYGHGSRSIQSMEGREHTGQVSNAARQDRESRFRDGELSTLFCSPTMELGIDISDLNVVHMRNVPPNPANYAQRSGRAGRSGQGALVITYASVGSGHDQYFFRRPQQMVAGAVAPPKLELGNRDLIQSHIYSIWLAHTGLYLGDSMNQILDLTLDGYPLKADIRSSLNLAPDTAKRCYQAAQTILMDRFSQVDLSSTSWYSEDWLRYILDHAAIAFDQACDRWRNLYSDAKAQLEASRQTIDRAAMGSTTEQEKLSAESQEREARRQIDLLVGQTKVGKQTQLEFYPYRYFASEGFLPGYNFPRLPVRTFVKSSNEGEFISRPRVVAIREFAPSNIVYYEGSKFQISKTRVAVGGLEKNYIQVGLCPKCGYAHDGESTKRDLCENCGSKIADDQRNGSRLTRVLPMDTMSTRRRERITCDEEERLKYGYNVTTHFRYANQRQTRAIVQAADGTELLRLTYGETADIWRINRGLRRSQERGFKLNTNTGEWGDPRDEQATELVHTEVHIMVKDTCNVLLIEPQNVPSEDAAAFIATLQYALERAIQAVYTLEEDELASERLGQGQYLLFWEAAEGGAGVLSQILENPQAFQRLAQEALSICHFQQEKESCTQACYECLLSYRNQFDHPLLNRHLIHPYLNQLTESQIQLLEEDASNDEHFQHLWAQTDPKSELERTFLEALKQRVIRLPDAAQVLIPEANAKPDFMYHDLKLAIFCDGSVHDSPDQRQEDRTTRDNLKHQAGYRILVFRYDEDWEKPLNILASLLKG